MFRLNRCLSRITGAFVAPRHALSSAAPSAPSRKPELTKIVATIGPKSEQLEVLKDVVAAGMRIMRINFSHATYDEADLRVKNLRLSPGLHDGDDRVTNLRAVLLDTQGPEIRTGMFADVKEVDLKSGQKVVLSTNDALKDKQTADKVWISYKKLMDTVKVGSLILLDDGAIEVKVESKDAAAGEIVCTVMNSGALGNKKGVNMPGLSVELPAMSEKDKEDIHWGVKNDIDYIAASFTRKASDVQEIKDYVATLMDKYHPKGHPHPLIISKIESTEALENFESILGISDGIMVARGDLGVEIPMETLTNVQKDLVRRANLAGKPVIVATQMLESMIKNPRPTRAECTDVSNAVFDGADCVMLSGESAKGKYPRESVGMMAKIVAHAETYGWMNQVSVDVVPDFEDASQGFAYAVAQASKNIHASCVVVLSETGRTATSISMFRARVPIVAVVPNAKAGRMLQMWRGVHPVLSPKDFSLASPVRFSAAVKHAKDMGFCASGDNVIVVEAENGSVDGFSNSLSMRLVTVA